MFASYIAVPRPSAPAACLSLQRQPWFHLLLRADWDAAEEDADDMQQWQDDWDDDNVTGDFSKSLRAEIDKVTAAKAAGAK